jgi:hypothetical protein
MKQTKIDDFSSFSKFVERLTTIERKRQEEKIKEETKEMCPYCYTKGGIRLLCSKRTFRCRNPQCSRVFFVDK